MKPEPLNLEELVEIVTILKREGSDSGRYLKILLETMYNDWLFKLAFKVR